MAGTPPSSSSCTSSSSFSSSSPSCSIPLSAAPMAAELSPHHPFSLASLPYHCARLGAEISARLDGPRRAFLRAAAGFSPLHPPLPLFACASAKRHHTAWAAAAPPGAAGAHAFDVALNPEYVARTLAGTRVYTVSNSNNEFVLISDPKNSLKSLGLLCFRQEDAQSLLAQV